MSAGWRAFFCYITESSGFPPPQSIAPARTKNAIHSFPCQERIHTHNDSTFSGSIAEAQECEYKLIEVQDWLTDKDILLSSHLEQGLTMEDLQDESQVGETNAGIDCIINRSIR